jgi:hypothetical protein
MHRLLLSLYRRGRFLSWDWRNMIASGLLGFARLSASGPWSRASPEIRFIRWTVKGSELPMSWEAALVT